jgi:hypothetical protein
MTDHNPVPPTASPHRAADEIPGAEEIARRARWLRSLTEGQRETLPDMSLREVERLYARWVDEVDRPAGR